MVAIIPRTLDTLNPNVSGAILCDGFVQSFLFGVILSQFTTYAGLYARDPEESWRKKVFMMVLLFLALFQTIVEDYKVWRLAILHFRWATFPIQWIDLFLNGLICSLCQTFFIRRCWKISGRSNWVLYPLCLLSLSIFAMNIYLAVALQRAWPLLSPADDDDRLKATRYLLPQTIFAFSYWVFASLALDTITTTILLVSLCRSKTGLLRADKLIRKVILMACESAALPAVALLVAITLYDILPERRDHLEIVFIVLAGKLHVVGLMRAQNARVSFRERLTSQDLGRTTLSTWQWEGN